MIAEMEAYKSAMDEMKQVVAKFRDKPNLSRETIEYLKRRSNKQLEEMQLNNRTHVIKIGKRMILKQNFDIEYSKTIQIV